MSCGQKKKKKKKKCQNPSLEISLELFQEVRGQKCVVQDPAGLTLIEDIFNIPIPSMTSQAFSRILML